MARFTSTERRSLTIAVSLLALATVARLLLAPGRADYEWRPAATARETDTVEELRRAVRDTLALEAEAARPLGAGEKIDVNRADRAQLQRLPGVGAARAEAIMRERSVAGGFASPADLLRVPGVGNGLVDRWRPNLAFSPTSPRPRPGTGDARVDLNRALPKELEQITGIGPVLARRIVEERRRRGRFAALEDLLAVPGIGPETLKRLRARAYVR